LHVDGLHVLARRRYRGSADAVRNNLDNIREVRARTIWCCVAAAHSAWDHIHRERCRSFILSSLLHGQVFDGEPVDDLLVLSGQALYNMVRFRKPAG